MRFLTDQDVFAATVRFLIALGHYVVTAGQLGHSQAKDEELLQTAHDLERILVTRDRDFGALVFHQSTRTGVIFLRMLPSNQDAVHQELERVLTLCSEPELRLSFVVIEPGRHRIRRLP